MRGDLGAIILAGAGRVYFQGESPRDWHTVVGSGFYFLFTVLEPPFSSSALHAR